MTKTIQAMYQELVLSDWQDAYAGQQNQAERDTPYFFAAQNENGQFTYIIIRNLGVGEEWLADFLSGGLDKSAIVLLELVGNAFSQVTLNAAHGLDQLKVLDVSYNKAPLSVEIYAALPALQGIYAVDAQLHRLHIVPYCPRLDQLIIKGAKNQTTNLLIHPKHFEGKWPLQMVYDGNPLSDGIQAFIQDDYEPKRLAEFFLQFFKKDLPLDAQDMRYCKLILLGNTNTGKTTLVHCLQESLADATGASTHGIQVVNYPCPSGQSSVDSTGNQGSIDTLILDYGGQDYYHNTHFAFYSANALYVLLYGNRQYFHFKGETKRKTSNQHGDGVQNDRPVIETTYPIDYWLRSVQHLARQKQRQQQDTTKQESPESLSHAGYVLYSRHNPHCEDSSIEELNHYALKKQFGFIARQGAFGDWCLAQDTLQQDSAQQDQVIKDVQTWIRQHAITQPLNRLHIEVKNVFQEQADQWLWTVDTLQYEFEKDETTIRTALKTLAGSLTVHLDWLSETERLEKIYDYTFAYYATPWTPKEQRETRSGRLAIQAAVPEGLVWDKEQQQLHVALDIEADTLYQRLKHIRLEEQLQAWSHLRKQQEIVVPPILTMTKKQAAQLHLPQPIESLADWRLLDAKARRVVSEELPEVAADWQQQDQDFEVWLEDQVFKEYQAIDERLQAARLDARTDLQPAQIETLYQHAVSRLDHLTTMIYALLDHRQAGQVKDGYVYPKDIQRWKMFKKITAKILNFLPKGYVHRPRDITHWQEAHDLTQNQVDYLLAFMCYHKIIFKSWRKDDNGKAIYIAPHHLKDQYSSSEKLLFQAFQPSFVEYQLTGFYHPSVFVDVIVQFREYIQRGANDCKYHYELWRNAAILCESKQSGDKDRDDHSAKPLLLLEFYQGLVLDETLFSKLPADKQRFDLQPDELSADEKTTIGYRAPCIRLREFVPPQAQGLEEGFKRRVMSYIEARIKGYEHQVLMRAPFGKHAKAAAPLIPQTALQQEVKNIEGQISDVFMVDNQLYRKADFRLFTSLKDRRNMQMKRVFISYSKEDLLDLRQLEIHLEPLKRQGMIATWHCSQLKGGDSWDATIQEHFNRAEVYCLLVSPNSMANNYIVNDELKRAVTRYHNDKTGYRIIPILLDYAHWSVIPELKEFQGIPYKGFPIRSLPNPSLGWHLVAEQIRRLIGSMNRADPDLDLSLETYDLYWKMMRKPQG